MRWRRGFPSPFALLFICGVIKIFCFERHFTSLKQCKETAEKLEFSYFCIYLVKYYFLMRIVAELLLSSAEQFGSAHIIYVLVRLLF